MTTSTLDRPASAAPRLDALLERLRLSLRSQVVLHGVGTAVAAAAAWLLFAFVADWLLHVPAPIRVFHALVLVALPAWVLHRELFQKLRRIPDRAGLAMLVERSRPDLHELLVSAVQLWPQDHSPQGGRRVEDSPEAHELVQQVIQEAERRAGGLDASTVIDPRGPRQRALIGAGASAATLLTLVLSGGLAGIFFQRMLGANVPWPQRTHLTLEIPIVGERAQIETTDDEIHVRIARGSDVPVHVRATGEVPDEVVLEFEGGERAVLSSGGTALFRTYLRSVQEDMVFSATGGDDTDGKPLVRLTVLQPPDVAGLAVLVVPPSYSGLPQRLEFDKDVEVLAGSRLTVHVLPDPPDATGKVRLLPEDREVPLESAPYPRSPSKDSAATPEPAVQQGLAFEIAPLSSVRYRFELVDGSASNPDPGLFGVQVYDDKRPEIVLLSPGRAEVDVVPGGALPLSVRAEDDFGIADLTYRIFAPEDPDTTLTSGTLSAQNAQAPSGRAGDLRIARKRLEVDQLADEVFEGRQLVMSVTAHDNREPEAQEGRSAPVRLRIVSGDEFLRRLQDALARAGEQANRLSDLQQGEKAKTRDILAAFSSDAPESGDAAEIGTLLTGQRRVQGDGLALARSLSSTTEGLLYSRIDDRAGALLDALEVAAQDHLDRSFHPEPWRELSRAYLSGQLGSAGLAGQLVKITGQALKISEEHAAAAVNALAMAHEATGPAATRDYLELAQEHQALAVNAIDRLLEQLAEWDNLQSILTLTRDILNRQKNLTERTRQFAKDN